MQRKFGGNANKSRRVSAECASTAKPGQTRESVPHPGVAELVKICGGEMVAPAGKSVTEEEVAAAQPEVIVLAWAATGDNRSRKRTK